jgi:hypothetical protein
MCEAGHLAGAVTRLAGTRANAPAYFQVSTTSGVRARKISPNPVRPRRAITQSAPRHADRVDVEIPIMCPATLIAKVQFDEMEVKIGRGADG